MVILYNSGLQSKVESFNQIYKIIRLGDGCYHMFKNNERYLVDTNSYIENYCKEIVGNNYNTALIMGLGMGIIPYYLINNCNTSKITIIEIDQNLINFINELGYLDKEKINIIQSNALTYIPKDMYDIVIVDIYFNATDEYLQTEKQNLINNCINNINYGGKFYCPIDFTFIEKNENLTIPPPPTPTV